MKTSDPLAADISHALSLAGENVNQYFLQLAPSHKNEYLRWIDEAKKPQTRDTRIKKMVQMINDKMAGES